MEIERIRELIEQLTALMDAKNLDELEVEMEGVKVALRRGRAGADQPQVVLTHPQPAAQAPTPQPTPEQSPPEEELHVVRSPMVGTFYRSPAPDADPYVEVGDEVGPDTVVCIIEAMKLMNEIESDISGRVVKRLVENAQPVEFGQTLFLVEPVA